MSPTRPNQRVPQDRTVPDFEIRIAYAKEHPLAFWFAVSAVVAGLVLVISPSPQAVSEVLPRYLQIIQGLFAIVGGLAAVYGLLAGRKNAEGAGFLFLAGTIVVNEVSAIHLHGTDTMGTFAWLVLAGIAFGCIRRCWHLLNPNGWRSWI